MTHKGKIGRLPLAIREQLNRRLQDGEIGRDLVVWLNSAPEVQTVLKAEFGERPVNEQNLSEWKTGGYEDWLVHQDTMAQVCQLVANAKELGGACNTPLSELLATCLAARYVVELGRLAAKAEGDGGCDLERLRKICRDVLGLRRLDLAAQRLRIEREAADREMRADEEERKEKLLKAERNHREWKERRRWMRANGFHVPFDPSVDDEADMQKEVAVEDLRWERDKLVALQAKIKENLERQEKFDQELEELEQAEAEALAREGETAEEEEKLAGEPEASEAAAAGQSTGGLQSSPVRKKRSKAEAQGAEPGTPREGTGPTGEANQCKSSQIKGTKGKSRMLKDGSASESLAEVVREAKILAGTTKEGE